MNKKMIARELVLVAKKLIAEDKDGYVYDPDHKNKPKGGGWEKTEKGWSKNNKKEKDKVKHDNVDSSSINITPEDASKLQKNLEKFEKSYGRASSFYSDNFDILKETKDIKKLDYFARNGDKNTRHAIALNKNISKQIMNILSSEDDEEVRCALAENESLTPEIQYKLLNDSSKVKSSLAENKNLSKDVREKLSKCNDPEVRASVAKHSKDANFLESLSRNEKSKKVLTSIACNPITPPDIVDLLIGKKKCYDGTSVEIVNAAERKDLSPETYDEIASKCKIEDDFYGYNWVAKALDNNEAVSESSLKIMFKRGFRPTKNPNMSAPFVREIAKSFLKEGNSDGLEELSSNPSAPLDVLENVFDNVENPSLETMLNIVKHPNADKKLIKKIKQTDEFKEKEIEKRKKMPELNEIIDLSKLSPELRDEVKDMDPEELGKFLGWLKKRKGMGGGAEEEAEV